MDQRKRTFSPEYRDEAVRLVIETSRPVAVVARELGLVEGTLGNWVNAYRRNRSCSAVGEAQMAGRAQDGDSHLR